MADPAYIVDGVLTDGEAWVGLATNTLSGTTTSITFTSPDDASSLDWSQFMDLVVVWYARSAHASTDDRMQIRLGDGSGIDTATVYGYQNFRGTGAAVDAGAGTYSSFLGGNFPGNSATANIFGCGVVQLFNVNSGKYTGVLMQAAGDRDGGGYVTAPVGAWLKQAPVKEIQFFADHGSGFLTGSRWDLFGILPRMVA